MYWFVMPLTATFWGLRHVLSLRCIRIPYWRWDGHIPKDWQLNWLTLPNQPSISASRPLWHPHLKSSWVAVGPWWEAYNLWSWPKTLIRSRGLHIPGSFFGPFWDGQGGSKGYFESPGTWMRDFLWWNLGKNTSSMDFGARFFFPNRCLRCWGVEVLRLKPVETSKQKAETVAESGHFWWFGNSFISFF